MSTRYLSDVTDGDSSAFSADENDTRQASDDEGGKRWSTGRRIGVAFLVLCIIVVVGLAIVYAAKKASGGSSGSGTTPGTGSGTLARPYQLTFSNWPALKVAWNSVSDATSYTLTYKIGNAAAVVISTPQTSWTFVSGSPEFPFATNIPFTIQALNSGGSSEVTTEYFKQPLAPPAAVKSFAAASATDVDGLPAVLLTWVSAPYATYYGLRYTVAGGADSAVVRINKWENMSHMYMWDQEKFPVDVDIVFSLIAFNDAATGSPVSTVTYKKAAPAKPSPIVLSSLKVSNFPNLRVSWGAVSNAASYVLAYQIAGGGGNEIVGITQTGYAFNNLVGMETAVTFTVCGVNEGGRGDSASVDFIATVNPASASFEVSADDTLTITWAVPTSNPTSWTIRWAVGPQGNQQSRYGTLQEWIDAPGGTYQCANISNFFRDLSVFDTTVSFHLGISQDGEWGSGPFSDTVVSGNPFVAPAQ